MVTYLSPGNLDQVWTGLNSGQMKQMCPFLRASIKVCWIQNSWGQTRVYLPRGDYVSPLIPTCVVCYREQSHRTLDPTLSPPCLLLTLHRARILSQGLQPSPQGPVSGAPASMPQDRYPSSACLCASWSGARSLHLMWLSPVLLQGAQKGSPRSCRKRSKVSLEKSTILWAPHPPDPGVQRKTVGIGVVAHM